MNVDVNCFDSSLARLRQRIHNDPDLQAHLFEINDIDQFVSALSKLIGDDAEYLNDEALRQAMQHGCRNWVERNLP